MDQPDPLNKLADQGHAVNRKAELREELLAREAAGLAASAATEAERMAAWRMAPLAYWLTWDTLPKIFFFSVWGTSLAMAAPYFIWFVTGEPVHGGSGSKRWVLDPTKEGYALFIPFVVLTLPLLLQLALRVPAWATARRRYKDVNEALASLPFAVKNYPDVLGGNVSRFRVKMQFQRTVPDKAYMLDVLAAIDPAIDYLADERGAEVELRIKYRDVSDDTACRMFFKSFQRLAHEVFAPLHQKHPIDRVEVS